MTPLLLDLVYGDSLDSSHRPSRQAPSDDILDRVIHCFPGSMEYHSDFQPREPPGPTSHEPSVGRGHLALAVIPRDLLDDHTTLRTVNAPRGVDTEHAELP